MPPTALYRLILCTTAALLLPGCGSPGIPGWLNAALCRRKSASLAQWNRGSAARPVLLSSAKACTAMIFDGDPVQVVSKTGDSGMLEFEVKHTGGTGIGSAVPVSADGYFLTAAHCAEDPARLTLVVLGKSGGLVQKRARLVWTSGDTLTGPDLALLQADLQPRAYFLFAQPEKLQPGDLVAATGWSQLNPATRSSGMAAGRLVKISPLRQGPGGFAWRRIDHNVPFNAGDSGGPLVSEQGLAGINARAWPGWTGAVRVMLHLDGPLDRPFPGYAAWSFAPDHAWLERTIEQDRAARRAVKL